jgi:hypothetical protein
MRFHCRWNILCHKKEGSPILKSVYTIYAINEECPILYINCRWTILYHDPGEGGGRQEHLLEGGGGEG